MDLASSEDKIKRFQSQTQALEIELAHRSEISVNATNDCKTMKGKLHNAQRECDMAKQETDEITQDMTRQYKGMQDDLLNKINVRERIMEDLRDKMKVLIEQHTIELQKRDKIIDQKNAEIELWRVKMEEVTAGFGNMLSNALRTMNERIEVHSSRPHDHSVPIQRRMEEFKLNLCTK